MSRVRVRELDGLRAAAVLLVFATHLSPSRLPGGYIGVEIFFVLSGYLITTLLLGEHRRTGSISLSRFYARRALRLAPALVVVTVFVVILALILGYGHPFPDGLAAVTYLTDLWSALLPHDNLLAHTWSLAVEEQFYLLWPLVLMGALRRGWNLSRLAIAVTGGFTIMTGALAISGDPDLLDRLYRLPTTHIPQLGLGIVLAVVLTERPDLVPTLRRFSGRPAVGVALVLCAGVLVGVEYQAPVLYRGGFLAIGFAGAALILHVLLHRDDFVPRMARWRPAVWLGERSYGFYLWHYPILVALLHLTGSTLAALAIGLPVSLLITGLSWRLVEQPFLKLKDRSGGGARAGQGVA